MLDLGIHVVAAAGNEGALADTRSPARMEKIITVGASDVTDKLWEKSNYGKPVDIIAPGVQIAGPGHANNSDVVWGDGTSAVSHLN